LGASLAEPRRQALLGARTRPRRDPQKVSTGTSTAQVLPASACAVLGSHGGLALFAAVSGDETGTRRCVSRSPATVLVIAVLTTIPARLGARRPAAEILHAELA
jgi:hypothetical protein